MEDAATDEMIKFTCALAARVFGDVASVRGRESVNLEVTTKSRSSVWIEHHMGYMLETPSYALRLFDAYDKLAKRLVDRLVYFEGKQALREFVERYQKENPNGPLHFDG